MRQETLLERLKEKSKEIMEEGKHFHDFAHVIGVYRNVEKLLKYETALKLSFSKFGFFYKDNEPKILWLGIKWNDKLIKLQKKIDINFEDIGFEPEKRKFKPHLTILRIKGNEDLVKLREFIDYRFSEENFLCNKIFFRRVAHASLSNGGTALPT